MRRHWDERERERESMEIVTINMDFITGGSDEETHSSNLYGD